MAAADGREETIDLEVRAATVRVGVWLGWCSIAVVLAGLATDSAAGQRWLLVGATLCVGALNAAATGVPWRKLLATRRGGLLLDIWCGGLIAFVALLVARAGTNFALLLFLVVPFIAVVQVGWRRSFWLAVSAGTCITVAALVPLSAGATAMRLALLAAVVAVALFLVRAIRRETTAHESAAVRIELERTLAREANHRIKNDLQTAADLLLLGRPDGAGGAAFDETASRIRSIAAVHRLLTEDASSIDGAALLQTITASMPVPVTIDAEHIALDAATAQKLGIVANELVTNAFQHGAPPIVVHLIGGTEMRLHVDDGGTNVRGDDGFGLDLVRHLVEQGLNGRLELGSEAGRGTRAEVVFPTASI
jgi:two-component sensor histidine kinase